MFADYAKIFIKSGKGGDGCVSFRRELYVAAGGPDGGDGGKGGDIIFEVDEGMNTLYEFRHKRKYIAEAGENGKKKNCTGKNGADLIIKVPEGTVIREENSGKVIADMSHGNKRCTILKGGKGGKGNRHFATAVMQVPQFAKKGQDSGELNVILELKVVADVGFVGFPNVGKSTLLSRISNARPKIANYHFTTLTPMLGVVDLKNREGFVACDIPGIIEGASEGVGLGHEFLRHIERNKILIHIFDISGSEGREPIEDIKLINNELKSYSYNLSDKKQILVANKCDLLPEDELIKKIDEIENEFSTKVYKISAVTGKGLDELLHHIKDELELLKEEDIIFEPEFEYEYIFKDEPYTIEFIDDKYVVEGPRIEKMLGYTNLDSEKGFQFFQSFLYKNGIIEKLEEMGIQEGDTVKMYGFEFDYYR